MAGPLTIVFLFYSLSLAEQGVYYALSTIMSIQFFFELGLLNILVSQTGHQNSALLAAENDVQRQQASGRLGQLIAASQTWFGVASMLYALAAIGLGWKILSDKSTAIEWWLPLVALSVVAAGTVALSPRLAILEGAGYRDSVYRTRLIQMVSGALVVWVTLLLGFKIWALVAAAGVQLLATFLLTHIFYHQFFTAHIADKRALVLQLNSNDLGLSWIKEVLPLQWRIALISMIYHAATQFFTVIVLKFDGEAEAGRLGMTMAVTVAIQGMSMAWIQTKFSLISAMQGAGQREQAGTLWRRTAAVSTGLLLAAMVVAICLVACLQLAERGWEDRFIEPWQMIVLGFGCLANHLVALQSFYVLSRKGRPFLSAAVVGFSATGIAVALGGYWYSTSGVVCAYTLATTLITLPLHSLAYWQYRRLVET
jgi:hypothetical protein